MQEEVKYEFSWSVLFIVTACCSFLFSGIIKLMDNDFPGLLLIIGGIASFLGILNWLGRLIYRQTAKKRKDQLVT